MIDRGPSSMEAALEVERGRVTERMRDAWNSLEAAKRAHEREPDSEPAMAWLDAANREAGDALAQAKELGIEPTHQGGAS